jgi:hypothetical protein
MPPAAIAVVAPKDVPAIGVGAVIDPVPTVTPAVPKVVPRVNKLAVTGAVPGDSTEVPKVVPTDQAPAATLVVADTSSCIGPSVNVLAPTALTRTQ